VALNWAALSGLGALFLALAAAAVVIGRVAARLFVDASDPQDG